MNKKYTFNRNVLDLVGRKSLAQLAKMEIAGSAAIGAMTVWLYISTIRAVLYGLTVGYPTVLSVVLAYVEPVILLFAVGLFKLALRNIREAKAIILSTGEVEVESASRRMWL